MRIKILYYLGWSLTRLLTSVLFRIRVTGRDNLPARGGFILASNHVSYYDPLVAGSWLNREVYFLAKKELFKNWLFGRILRRVNAIPLRRGSIDRHALAAALEVIRSDFGLVLFPEGTRSRTGRFLEPKVGIGKIALETEVPIVPCYLHGTDRLLDCFLGRKRMSVTLGTPLLPSEAADGKSGKENFRAVAQSVMVRIGEIRRRVTGLKGSDKSVD
ncbi:MAG: 1-acyl-sn-glycerol-3-phosphate acyltransferase [Candidatus Zixiibacteriota bacterium]|nr:MAG: 1-acyl-sn-glycerol-3-phosphate acyltransferase [candidate division Zixibacteria bacterium]